MVDFDISKLLLVAVLALIVLGPEKLPKAARMAAVLMRRLRVGWVSVRAEVERELELEELRGAVQRARTTMSSAGELADRQFRAARAAVDATAADVTAAVAVPAATPPAAPPPARPGCSTEDIDRIAGRARAAMDDIQRIADREAHALAARTAHGGGVADRSVSDLQVLGSRDHGRSE